MPSKLGPSEEIQELRNAFARAIDRAEESERETTSALEGQRRLVREVHHRVKNNLQVVASLLNIHGRSAEAAEARSAYAGISRRVGALSIVHRNHFAEMEENRGISLRPLVTELAAELRASAPETARGLAIDLDLDSLYTTQDAAVAVAFLITEIVEFAMLHAPADPVELSIRRTSELTARLSLGSPVLVPDDEDEPGKSPVRADRRRPRQAASFQPRPQAWPVQRGFASISTGLAASYGSLRRQRKKFRKTCGEPEPISKKGRYAVRIVTFCPPALAIRLNGPGTANPPPPRWRFRALFCLGLHPQSEPDRAAFRAARQCVMRIARIANSYRP